MQVWEPGDSAPRHKETCPLVVVTRCYSKQPRRWRLPRGPLPPARVGAEMHLSPGPARALPSDTGL